MQERTEEMYFSLQKLPKIIRNKLGNKPAFYYIWFKINNMTNEQLQKGKDIEGLINAAKKHKEEVLRTQKDWKFNKQYNVISFSTVNNRTRFEVLTDFIPISSEEYMELYIYKIDCYIRKKHQELKNL